jgi:DNA modification methylase
VKPAVIRGDALHLPLPDSCVDAIVTDPPYSLSFMGKSWDDHGTREDVALGYWLAGFIDGEGCFLVKGHGRGTYAPTFTLKVRRDDRAALVQAQRFVRAGQVEDVDGGDARPQVRWAVQDREGCQRLVDVLDKYPLRAKKRLDYLLWREAVCEWTDRPRGNRWDGPADQSRMVELRDAIRRAREYVEPPWTGHGFGDWCRMWAAEALRVAKPGAHLAAFGGTRTWHRLTVGLEDAGWEIRDTLMWLYGCHDDQTEVLTRRGWVNGLDLRADDDVAQWATDGTVSLVRPTARQRYTYDGHMVRFRHSDVDQLVTPNHRVYRQVKQRQQVAGNRVASWSPWQVDAAGTVNRWETMRLPAAGIHDGPGIGGTDYAALLGWVWTEGGFDLAGTGVRVYQSSTNQPLVDEIAALFDRLGQHKRYDYQRQWKGREYTSTTWFITGELANQVRADLPGKSPTYDLLWRMTADEKWALWDAAMKGDGSKAQRVFWQKSRADLEWAQALLAGIGCRGKVGDDPRGVLFWTDRDTVELQHRHLQDDGEDYLGEVWCVTVPSGAFIVRRNGRVSVSGNSGFPKSLDVSKAIDRAAGAERDKVQYRPRPATSGTMAGSSDTRPWIEESRIRGYHEVDGDTPATAEAAQWDGWGTALKPAWEPIVLARKPLTGTVAANVTDHGVGALNIDACRIGTTVRYNPPGATNPRTAMGDGWRDDHTGTTVTGRWPANLLLDTDTARLLDQHTGTSTAGTPRDDRGHGGIWNPSADGIPAGPQCGDSGGPSRFYYTAKAGRADRGDGNNHPTVKPVDLMRWLIRLVTPRDGLVLDPFAGSGTTGQAAEEEGRRCVLVERDPGYCELIQARVDRPAHLTLDLG